MAKGKPTPQRSKIERGRAPLAYSRRQKDGDAPPDEAKSEKTDDATEKTTDAMPADKPTELTAEVRETLEAPALETPPPPKGEPWPDATPQPMRPVEPPKAAEAQAAAPASARARTETITIPSSADFGSPPAMPGTVEDPTRLPGPRDIPEGNVTDAALPPGRVPSGDSRSLRKGNEFALIYRIGTAVIERFGTVGQRGQWRVVEYPTPASAASSYAKEVSRFVGEGFVDYRE
ncbi:MAG: hypothetical protein JNL83_23290 [Myxococcales bacterium]|nr:hypothetical protein [Myxococcales bacterium]